jgi:DNA invertase Pin-like site-specific DNA recombinase
MVATRNAPYGFYLSSGQLKPDTREQEIIQKILEMYSKGMSYGAIARSLNDQKIRPRLAKKWSQVVVGFIIKRHSNKTKRRKNRWEFQS